MHWWNLMEKWRSIATSTYNHHHGPKTYPMPIQDAMHPNLCGNFKSSPRTYRSPERVKFQKNQPVLNKKTPEILSGGPMCTRANLLREQMATGTLRKKQMGKCPKSFEFSGHLDHKKNKIQHKMSENALNYLEHSIRKEKQERKNKPKTLWISATIGSE